MDVTGMMDDWGVGDAVSYGQGASYQGSCPTFPPPPPGYSTWNVDVNGQVPADVVARAKVLASDMTKPLGYTETIYSGGVSLILRVDPHTWTTDAKGNYVAGCFHGVSVYIPMPETASSSSGGSILPSNDTITTLFMLSLGLGAIVSAISIYEAFHRHARTHR
jgi:hypothetical protein